MSRLIELSGSEADAGGQLRAALALSAATGQGFALTQVRASRPQPGLTAQDVAAVRAAGIACGARVGGAFDGSPDLRFEPGPVAPGEFRFEIAAAAAVTLVLQAILPPLATASAGSRVEITGGTHVPASPLFEAFARPWKELVARLGLVVEAELVKAGFFPPGGGEVRASVAPWARPAALALEERGALVAIRGVSGQARLKSDAAARQVEAARRRLWEARRLEAAVEVVELPAASPGSFLLLDAVFENGRAAFALLGRRGLAAETLGDQAARLLLKFLEEEAALDPHLAAQLLVPLALARGGGRLTTSEVTAPLQAAAEVATAFGFPVRVFGRRGGPGGAEADAC